MLKLRGSYVALITPFNEDGSVNFKKLEELCEFQISNGTDGIVVLGTTGESSTMSHEEDEDVVRCALSAISGRCALIAGSGSNSTETAIMKSVAYDKLGVDGLLLITPYYNKANQTGMVRHFTDVADRVSAPIIVYNVPGRTGCALSVGSVEKLSAHKNIIGIKEASGDMSYVMNIAHLASDDFAIVSGNDDITVPVMAAGGTGVISVLANVCPRETADMVHAYLAGDAKTALALQLEYLELIHALFMEVNPIPVKEALNLMGMNVGPLRMPLCEMEPEHREKLTRVLAKYGLLKA
ncbi:MAG: 4-hydroxy-tetrahydrodipicolinate synthase [Clostridia bacterium]|nr:4-hydroxy-tetrahydrodipicolinate synthase [Clostridia bacterium]